MSDPRPLDRKTWIRTLSGTWLAGLLALLPLALTMALVMWVASLVHGHLGPGSTVGRLLSAFGQPFAAHPLVEYALGAVLLALVIFPLGLLMQSRLRGSLERLVDRTLHRIPVVGNLYKLADRFVGLLDQRPKADLGAMRPVWCFFGGDGAAVLALQPRPEPILIEGRSYMAVLVPTAPVPIGGGLLYLPSEWVRPAELSVERLTTIYLSMGLVPPSEEEPRPPAIR